MRDELNELRAHRNQREQEQEEDDWLKPIVNQNAKFSLEKIKFFAVKGRVLVEDSSLGISEEKLNKSKTASFRQNCQF